MVNSSVHYREHFCVTTGSRMMDSCPVMTAHVHVCFDFMKQLYHLDVTLEASTHRGRVAIFIRGIQVGAQLMQGLWYKLNKKRAHRSN